MLSPLQYDQLVLLEQQINQKINSNDPGTDVGYWESLLQQLKAHMARVSPTQSGSWNLWTYCVCVLIAG